MSEWIEQMGAESLAPPVGTTPVLGLVAAARAGDGAAFAALIRPHLALTYQLCSRVCGRGALADDAAQETITLVFEKLDRFRPDASFKAFVAGIAVKKAHALARGERRRRTREDAAVAPANPDTPEELASAAVSARRLQSALSALPKKRREAALLRFDAGLSYREIAEAIGSTEGSARVLVHKATASLRSALRDLLNETQKESE